MSLEVEVIDPLAQYSVNAKHVQEEYSKEHREKDQNFLAKFVELKELNKSFMVLSIECAR